MLPTLHARRSGCFPHADHDATPGPDGAAGDAAHTACARRAHGRPAASRYVVPAHVVLRGAGQGVVFEGMKRTRRRVRREAARRRGVWWGWGGVSLGVCWSGVARGLVELGRREEGVWRGFAITCGSIFSGPEGFVELMSVLLKY